MFRLMRVCCILLAVSVVLAACNLPIGRQKTSPTPAEEEVVAQTVSALQTALAVNTTPAAGELATATLATVPATQVATQAVATTLPQPTATSAPSYKAGFVTDVTIPDNTVVKPGEAFKKTWRLRNDGNATWSSNYKLVFVSGDAMSGPASKTIGQSVAPGATIDISVDLTAPTSAKTYIGNWMLQTDTGTNFGIGPNATSSFYVKIVVQEFFAVTNAVPVVAPVTWTGVCPVTLALTANITTTAAGTVTYYYKTSLGDTPTQELEFDKAGTLTTPAYSFPVPSSTAFSVQVYIDNPNHQLFSTVVTVPVTCAP